MIKGGSTNRLTCFLYVIPKFKEDLKSLVDTYLYDWDILTEKTHTKYIDFIFSNAYIPSFLRYTPSRLKNCVDGIYEIADKERLHHHLKSICPESIAETEVVDENTIIPDGEVYILRANWGESGSANAVVTNTADLQEFYAKNKSPPYEWMVTVPPKVIMSKYITEPYLWNLDGKMHKFHARINLVIVVMSTNRYVMMMNEVMVVVSAKPYINGDYDNKDYHDTHMRYNPREIYMDDDPKVRDLLLPKGIDLLKLVMPGLMDKLKSYPEAENSYAFLGVDMMWDGQTNPKIIEMNNKPSHEYSEGSREKVREVVLGTAFNDVFYPDHRRGKDIGYLATKIYEKKQV